MQAAGEGGQSLRLRQASYGLENVTLGDEMYGMGQRSALTQCTTKSIQLEQRLQREKEVSVRLMCVAASMTARPIDKFQIPLSSELTHGCSMPWPQLI